MEKRRKGREENGRQRWDGRMYREIERINKQQRQKEKRRKGRGEREEGEKAGRSLQLSSCLTFVASPKLADQFCFVHEQ